jgi:hypothetical protein
MSNNRSVNIHDFSMIPKTDVPRSRFDRESIHKTTFDSGWLIPVYVDEVLPGDSFGMKATFFARLTTPIFPIVDNLHLESFFFFVPNRLLWSNWQKFMGEQKSPGDSISYLVPTVTSPASGYAVNSIFDYMGLPTVGQVGAAATVTHNSLALRAYNIIFNEWFRDENLVNPAPQLMGDGPDASTNFALLRRGKRHDYFTSALPWPQKGAAVTLPLGTTAPIKTWPSQTISGIQQPLIMARSDTGALPAANLQFGTGPAGGKLGYYNNASVGSYLQDLYPANLYADLSQATSATINSLRQAFQIQKLLERDARGGTRYTELLRAHFGVTSPDARLQRPEYLGGGSTNVNINPISQTSGTGVTGGTTPLGTLAAMGTALGSNHGFRQVFTEHGIILGLINVRADLTYQQGMRRLWSRSTRYDFYWPEFASLGEQAILNKEIYCKGDANDNLVFGYQERWAEYRYLPSLITGRFRSTSALTLDAWHLAQNFSALPTLNATFINDTPPLQRILAVGAAAAGSEFYLDSFFQIRTVRPMPMYSVPGFIDHF